jgi:acetyl esterase
MKIVGTLILLTSLFTYFIAIKDPEIPARVKLWHYMINVADLYIGIGYEHFDRSKLPKLTLKSRRGDKFPDLHIEEFNITSKSDGHKILVEILVPKNYDPTLSPIVQIHGGGFVLQGHAIYPGYLTENGNLVVSIFYRLAPEHPFPSGVNDCFEAFQWIYSKEHPLLKDIDISKIIIIGDSAGGNIAAGLSYRVRDDASFLHKISKQILVYPVTRMDDTPTESRLKTANSGGYLLTIPKMIWFSKQYHHDRSLLSEHPLATIEKAKDHKNLPETLVLLGLYDPLFSEGKIYAELLRDNGNKVFIKEYPMIHGSFAMEFIEEGMKALNDTLNFIKE